jgi:hypothetical protein
VVAERLFVSSQTGAVESQKDRLSVLAIPKLIDV